MLRVGIPQPGGQILAAARAEGFPILMSANAFAVTYPAGHEMAGEFRKFKLPDPTKFGDADIALDSAGFVAAVVYGDYRWTVEEYFDLVVAHKWAWYSSLDYCCEPEVACDKHIRLLRIAATAHMYGRCAREAEARGLPAPMPVLQGWTPEEYLMCIDWMPIDQWPDMIGIGSVCRRNLHGSDGIIAVVDALDRVLPAHVKFHLFGVKGSALGHLSSHPRVKSADSMAWDFAARAERRTGRTAEFRIGHMKSWVERQSQAIDRPAPGMQAMLFDPREFPRTTDFQERVLNTLAMYYADMIQGGELGYREAVVHCQYDAFLVLSMFKAGSVTLDDLSLLDEVFGGLAELVEDDLSCS